MALRKPIGRVMESAAAAEFEFRLMTPDDLDAVVRIERQSFSDPWTRDAFTAEITGAPVRWPLVAVRNGRLTGYVIAWFIEDESHIANLAVVPGRRRRGLGRVLMERAIDEGRKRGVRYMHLEVRPSNASAISLYRSLGFNPTGLRKRYYTDTGEDAVIMTRPIEPPDAERDPAGE